MTERGSTASMSEDCSSCSVAWMDVVSTTLAGVAIPSSASADSNTPRMGSDKGCRIQGQ